VSFTGFGFDYSGWPVIHPLTLLHLNPLLCLTLMMMMMMMMKKKKKTMSEASRRPPPYLFGA
jgi:hypothetical protein